MSVQRTGILAWTVQRVTIATGLLTAYVHPDGKEPSVMQVILRKVPCTWWKGEIYFLKNRNSQDFRPVTCISLHIPRKSVSLFLINVYPSLFKVLKINFNMIQWQDWICLHFSIFYLFIFLMTVWHNGRNVFVCFLDINECETLVSPCQFGGTCNNIDGSYFCVCPEGRGGDYCEISKYRAQIWDFEWEMFLFTYQMICRNLRFEVRFKGCMTKMSSFVLLLYVKMCLSNSMNIYSKMVLYITFDFFCVLKKV